MTTPNDEILTLAVNGGRQQLDTKGGIWRPDVVTQVQRSVEDLRQSLANETRKILEVIETLNTQAGSFRCEEVEVTLEATVEGGFKLVGSATASVGAALTLRFRRA